MAGVPQASLVTASPARALGTRLFGKRVAVGVSQTASPSPWVGVGLLAYQAHAAQLQTDSSAPTRCQSQQQSECDRRSLGVGGGTSGFWPRTLSLADESLHPSGLRIFIYQWR